MNIFLVGNGFDLYHGLPTKYENFLHTMEYIINHKNDDLYQYSVGEIFKAIASEKMDSFIEKSYKKYESAYNQVYFEKQDINTILALSNNMWLNYFIDLYNKDLGWIDFEKEIAFVLKQFYAVLCPAAFYPQALHVLRYFSFFYDMQANIIVHEVSDISIKEEYKDKNPFNFNNYKPDQEKIVDKLFDSLKKLITLLKLYLKFFVEKPLDLTSSQEIINNHVFKKANYVVNFNYTNTFEKLYGLNKDKVFHLHGDIDNEMVLGINPDSKDELNELDTTFIQFKKYYQRIVYRTDLNYQGFIKSIGISYSQSPTLSNSNNFIVIVAGHSLDKTDEDIIKQVFNLADKIVILCHNDQAIGKYIKNLITIYGKKEFDNLRSKTDLEFTSYENLDNVLL